MTGEGARLYGGRWNPPGVAMVYAAESRALAALEMLVHLQSQKLLASYVAIELRFNAKIVENLPVASLPDDWRSDPAPLSTQAIGSAWVTSNRLPVLRVPSVLIPEEFNYLLNPRHPGFAEIEIGDAVLFTFDPRLAV